MIEISSRKSCDQKSKFDTSNFFPTALSTSSVGFYELASSVKTGISVPSSKISNLILAGGSNGTIGGGATVGRFWG
jgi:hypothetical protein